MNLSHHQNRHFFALNRVLSILHAALLVLSIVAISLVFLLPNAKRRKIACNSTTTTVKTNDQKKQLNDDASKNDPNKYFAVHLTPEQVHISLGASLDEFVITWITLNKTASPSTVKFGLVNTAERTATGTMTSFTDEGPLKMKRYVHRVRLTKLLPGKEYVYHCGSSDSWSNLYRFKTLPTNKKVGPEWTLNLLIFGDLGNGQAKTLSLLQDEVELRKPDLVVQVGDFAYNLEDDNGRMGDAFFRDIEPITTQRPFQVCVGNHEAAYNFSHYDNRFSMYSEGSTEKNNWFWSQNIGNVHLVAFSTEFYYFPEYYSRVQVQTQYRWLQEDLKNANRPENRRRWPWIVTMGHRPMYNEYYVNNKIRVGNADFPGLEKLFYENGVDLAYWGHDHIYERIYPVYDGKVLNSSSTDPYRNPKSLVHLTTGSAGCILSPPTLNPHRPDYSAYANADYSYTRMAIFNDTHLKVEQISQNQGGKAIDEFYLIKEKHGPYN